MKVRFTQPEEQGSMFSHGKEYAVYWISVSDKGATYGVLPDCYEFGKYPLDATDSEFEITDPTINPLWIVAYENGEPHELSLAPWTLLIAHPEFIAQERLSNEKKGFFVERIINNDVEALAIWEKIKA